MARRIAETSLNASSMNIMNVIRQNASYEYQQSVPVVERETDIPKVGEVIYGTPAFKNQFINALVNRIASVRMQSATFNNPYAVLKKGYIEFGETIEEIFVGIANGVKYSAEKAPAREFKRTLPDVRSAFHVMNWRVIYPVTIQDSDLKQAFLSLDGVTALIEKIVKQVYTAAEYDEFLLFKYMLIKTIAGGSVKTLEAGSDWEAQATNFRGISNLLPFISTEYNEYGVKTNTPKDRVVIFMDAMYNAGFDVNVLASAFNMDKADFMGRLFLIDNWTSFDNDRFEVIRAESDGIEEVTAEELAALANVKAVVLDEEWFQIYDNNNQFTETFVASGLYWNYFYHTWKTVSYSPFANAVAFEEGAAPATAPDDIRVYVTSIDNGALSEGAEVDEGKVYTFEAFTIGGTEEAPVYTKINNGYKFVQTEGLTEDGVGIEPMGIAYVPASKDGGQNDLVVEYMGETYSASITWGSTLGGITLSK